MFPSESHEGRRTQPTAVNSGEAAPQHLPAYAAPQLVVLGPAHDLVQGCDLYKNFVDCNGYYRD